MNSTTAAMPEARERRAAAVYAAVLGGIFVAGFGAYDLLGKVVTPVPPIVFLHAGVFAAWVLVFIAQAGLIRNGRRVAHRQLGWLAVLLAVAMVVVGWLTARATVHFGRVPPAFTPEIFLSLSALEVLTFGLLVVLAIVLRRRTDWHRRLMIGATIALVGPAWGRLLLLAGAGAATGPLSGAMQLLCVAVPIAYDVIQRRRLHPAWYPALLAVLAQAVGTPLIGTSGLFTGTVAALTGT